MFNGEVEVIKRGTFITSMVKLAERWNMDRATVKRFLDTLQNDEMISYSCNNRRTLIKVLNYEVFQGGSGEYTTTDTTTDSATDTTTDSAQHKNIKKVKESKEDLKKLNRKGVVDVELDKAISNYVDYRESINKPLTPYSLDTLIDTLNKMTSNVSEQIEILNQSVIKGWVDIYPLKKKQTSNSNNKTNAKAQELDEFYKMAAEWAEGE